MEIDKIINKYLKEEQERIEKQEKEQEDARQLKIQQKIDALRQKIESSLSPQLIEELDISYKWDNSEGAIAVIVYQHAEILITDWGNGFALVSLDRLFVREHIHEVQDLEKFLALGLARVKDEQKPFVVTVCSDISVVAASKAIAEKIALQRCQEKGFNSYLVE